MQKTAYDMRISDWSSDVCSSGLFAVSIAISTVISAINSLTLSPALAARLLKAHDAPKDRPSRLIDRLFGWLFRPFNRFFKRSSDGYQGVVSRTLGRRGAVF